MTSSGELNKRALIVGSDLETRGRCRAALERAGFSVEAVENGIEAVIAARNCPPAVVVMDLQLSDVPGSEAIKWLRSLPSFKSTPIITLTTGIENDTALALTRTSQLHKPVSPAAFQRAIHDFFPYCVV